MRDYAKGSPAFWTSDVADDIRGDPWCVALAWYLITSPHSNMLGLYRLPMSYLLEDLGWTKERACEALGKLSASGFCRYDKGARAVWVVEAARHEWGEQPNLDDNRVKALRKAAPKILRQVHKSDLVAAFRERYSPGWDGVIGEWPKPLARAPQGLGDSVGSPTEEGSGSGAGSRDGKGSGSGDPPTPRGADGELLFACSDGERAITIDERSELELIMVELEIPPELLDPWLVDFAECLRHPGGCSTLSAKLGKALARKLRQKPPEVPDPAAVVEVAEWRSDWMKRIRPDGPWRGSDRGWFDAILGRYENDGKGRDDLDRDLEAIADRWPEKPSGYWTTVIRGAQAKGKLGRLAEHLDDGKKPRNRTQPHGVTRPPIVMETPEQAAARLEAEGGPLPEGQEEFPY